VLGPLIACTVCPLLHTVGGHIKKSNECMESVSCEFIF